MPWLSEPSIEIAPISCSTSSAAMVCGADAAFGKGDILRNRRVEMMAHHRHVEMFVEGVDGVGIGRIGRRRQAVLLAGDADDIGRVAAAGALGVVHVDGAAADRLQRVFDEAGFVERVGVELDLKIDARRRPAGRYRSPPASSPSLRGASGRCTPVSSCSTSGGTLCELPRPRKPKFIGQASAACSILPVLNGPPESMPTVIGPSEPPIMVVMPLRDRMLDQAGAVEMHMDVDGARGGNHALAIAHRGRRSRRSGADRRRP